MRIFREELDGFLPERILDVHVHIINEGVIPEGNPFSSGGHPITKYDLEDLKQDLAEVYPGRETLAACFGLPQVDFDRAHNNRYLAAACDRKRFFPFRLFDPHEDGPDSVRRDIVEGRYVGIKPYPDYVRKGDPNQAEVFEMLPPWIMEVVNDLRLIVMLHLPRKGRLADPVNQKQVMQLCARYPKARIILAHIGRAYFLRNIVGNLEGMKEFPNLYFDLAMLNNWEVLEYLFANFPPERILYGTDIPISLAPGKSVEINDQYTYVTPVPWHLSISDDHRKIVFTSFLYEELRAIKKAAERLRLSDDFVGRIFHASGMQLFHA